MLPLLPRRLTSVTILNGNGVAGAAATEASRVRARGYKIGQVGNAPRGGFGTSVVMYRAGRVREGRRLARDLGIAIVSPLDGLRKGDLHGAKLRRRGRRLILVADCYYDSTRLSAIRQPSVRPDRPTDGG